MRKPLTTLAFLFAGLGFLALPAAAYASVSVSVQSLSPSTTVSAGTTVSFSVAAAGFSNPTYTLSDSFSGSSASNSNIDGNGNFSWTPNSNDVGSHTLTISVQDSAGDNASVQEQITVLSPVSLSIQSLSPGSSINSGQTVTFSAAASGFNNPSYSVSDSFGGSTLVSTDINPSGYFSWTPQTSDAGTHTLTVSVTDSLGHSASAQTTISVGSVPTAVFDGLPSGDEIPVGSPLTFTVGASGFSNPTYSISDSFGGSTVSSADINSSGYFSWTPQSSDVGLHTFTVSVSDSSGHSATAAQQITVESAQSVSSSSSLNQSQIQSIVALLQSFGANSTTVANVSGVLNGTATSVSTPTASTYVFTDYLYPGLTSGEVSELQTVLAQQGDFSGSVTGYYGTQTEQAVIAYQAAHGIEQLGVVGPATRASLNALGTNASSASTTTFTSFLTIGDSGSEVLALQQKLAQLGYLTATPNGYFGAQTQAAVEAFQSAHGIEAVGYVGPATRAALNQ